MRTCVRHLVRESLLNLQPPSKHLHYAPQPAPQAGRVAGGAGRAGGPRQVGQAQRAVKGQQVVLALRAEGRGKGLHAVLLRVLRMLQLLQLQRQACCGRTDARRRRSLGLRHAQDEGHLC